MYLHIYKKKVVSKYIRCVHVTICSQIFHSIRHILWSKLLNPIQWLFFWSLFSNWQSSPDYSSLGPGAIKSDMGFDDGHLSETRPEEDFAPLLKESFLFRGSMKKMTKLLPCPNWHSTTAIWPKRKKNFQKITDRQTSSWFHHHLNLVQMRETKIYFSYLPHTTWHSVLLLWCASS